MSHSQLSSYVEEIMLVRQLLTIIGILSALHVHTQPSVYDLGKRYHVQGKIVDQKTGKGIPFCKIFVGETNQGTSSNSVGEFAISADSLPMELSFSTLAYKDTSIMVLSRKEIVVELNPVPADLRTESILERRDDVFELLDKTLEKISKSKVYQYGKASYTQTTSSADSIIELSEIVYDIIFSSKGIESTDLRRGRYATTHEPEITFLNFPQVSSIVKTVQPSNIDLIFPLHPEMEKYYKVDVTSLLIAGSKTIAVVTLAPAEKRATNVFEGELHIDVDSYDLLKIRGKLKGGDHRLIKPATKDVEWKDYRFLYEIAYRENSLGLALDYVTVEQKFDLFKNEELVGPITTSSHLNIFHYASGIASTNFQEDFKPDYSKELWEKSVIKRTADQQSKVHSFEKSNHFKGLFVNSRGQIDVLEIRNHPSTEQMQAALKTFREKNMHVKVFLHADKSKVIPGETLWYSAYLTQDAFHSYSQMSKVLHVDLINSNNSIVVSKTHKITNGTSAGEIIFPSSTPPGTYVLRAYTNWMRNFDNAFFFAREVEVVISSGQDTTPKQKETEKLKFFPEGGRMISSTKGRIAFKAVDSNGEAVSDGVEGNIVDSKGNVVTFFKSLYQGMGIFFLKPNREEMYTAILKDGSEYVLPAPVESGFSLIVNNGNKSSINVVVEASRDWSDKPFYAVATMGNQIVYKNSFRYRNDLIEFEIPKSNLPGGVLSLAILDANNVPKCRRDLLVPSRRSLFITTTVEESEPGQNEEMVLGVRVTDMNGNPVSTNLSLAVTDLSLFAKAANHTNLTSYLMIDAESQESFENSSFVSRSDRTSVLKTDLLMLTNSFRGTDWNEVLTASFQEKEFSVAQGVKVSGTAKWIDGLPLRNTELTAVAFSEENITPYTATTDEKGRFLINDFNEEGAVNVIFSAYSKRGKLLQIRVTLDENVPSLPIPDYVFSQDYELQAYSGEDSILRKSFDREQYTFGAFDEDATFLDEVTVEARKIDEERTPSVYGITPDATRYIDKDVVNYYDYLQVLSTIPGVQYTGAGITATVNIQGTVSIFPVAPLWILDGTIIAPDGGASNVPSFIANLNPMTVDRIEVLKGASGAIFGSRAAGGVILIYTKTGGADYTPSTSNLEVSGHSAAKTFDPRNEDGTNRSTLYWNPNIRTDQFGEAKVVFYNTTNAKDVQVDIQALSDDGLLGSYLKSIQLD